jgi:hypothetical protein
MIRAPLRPVVADPVDTTPRAALDYELTQCWPRDGSRRRFWTGDRVPAHLHEHHAPDPRQVLEGDAGRLAHELECGRFRAARLRWLRG